VKRVFWFLPDYIFYKNEEKETIRYWQKCVWGGNSNEKKNINFIIYHKSVSRILKFLNEIFEIFFHLVSKELASWKLVKWVSKEANKLLRNRNVRRIFPFFLFSNKCLMNAMTIVFLQVYLLIFHLFKKNIMSFVLATAKILLHHN